MKRIISLWFVAYMFALSPAHGAEGFDACSAMFPGGVVPEPKPQSALDLCKQADGQALFAIRYDTARKTPNWTAHLLTPERMAQITTNSGKMKRPKFKPDAEISRDDQAAARSYVNSGFSRGHIVPANDMSWSKAAYNATFHFSNVVPQKQTFNAGTWLGEEAAFRKYVKSKNTPMWVFSGVYGTVEDAPATIGPPFFAPKVPKCFYKIVVTQPTRNGPYKVLAALYDWNDFGKRRAWVNSITPLQTVEARTGIDFFKDLTVESTYDSAYWALAMPDTPGDCQ